MGAVNPKIFVDRRNVVERLSQVFGGREMAYSLNRFCTCYYFPISAVRIKCVTPVLSTPAVSLCEHDQGPLHSSLASFST